LYLSLSLLLLCIPLSPTFATQDVRFEVPVGSGRSDRIVIADGALSTTDQATITTAQAPYFVIQYRNAGTTAIPASSFSNRMVLNGATLTTKPNQISLGAGASFTELGFASSPPLQAGTHVAIAELDVFGQVDETGVPGGESNNIATRHFLVRATAGTDLAPLFPVAAFGITPPWSDRLVISTVPGTSTDAPTVTSADTLYIDWFVMNYGPAPTAGEFSARLKLDGNVVSGSNRIYPGPLGQFQGSAVEDAVVPGPLAPGLHTLTLEIDYANAVTEADEGNNTYSRTFVVEAVTPVITSSLTASGNEGTPFSYQIAASYFPESFDAAGLPAGLSVDTASGLVSGTPATNGAFDVTLSAFNAAGTGSASLTLTIGPSLTMVSTSADSGSGSLRQIVADAPAGAVVSFASHLSGATIPLTSGQIMLDKNLTIDASALADPVTVSGSQVGRVFLVNPGVTNVLTHLVITDGLGVDGPSLVAEYGGGIFNQGILTLNNCQISSNSGYAGGGIYNNGSLGGELTLEACVLVGNEAQYGGAVQNEGTLVARNSIFSGNVCTQQGGAISAPFGASVELTHCTVADNTAAEGGGIFGTSVSVTNSIVYFNTATTSANYGNGTFAYSCAAPLPPGGSGNIDADPQFVAMDNLRLHAGSPCLDAGNDAYAAGPTDLDGNPRIVHGTTDMGAFENQTATYVWYVATNGNDAANGLGWATARRTIQSAVDRAYPGDTVVVSNGVYAIGSRTVGSASLPNRVVIPNGITVASMNGPEDTIIEGQGQMGNSAVRCAYVGANAVLSGFTLSNGATRASSALYFEDMAAGGVYCEIGAVVTNCTITRNWADTAGGAYQGTLNDCVLSDNFAERWGGGARASTLNHCVLSGNSAGLQGGGVFRGTLMYCTVSGNDAGDEGGGAIFAALSHCTVSGNWAGFLGGGADSCTLTNCTLTGNVITVSNGGGGGASRSTLVSCTVRGNRAGEFNGVGGGTFGGSAKNSIVYGNEANYENDFEQTGPYVNHYSTDFEASCTAPLPDSGAGNITGDPLFVGWNDLHLQSNSPCIDAGNNSYVVGDTDLEGNLRIVNGIVDMGAFEYQGPEPTGYEAWAAAITNGQTNYHDSATGGGYPNLLKYATGSSPTNADDLARLAIAWTNGMVQVQFNRNTNAVDVTVYVEGNENLGESAPWVGLATNRLGSWGADTNVVETGTGTPVAVSVAEPASTATNRVYRLQVTRP
jgi:hypothetical protein